MPYLTRHSKTQYLWLIGTLIVAAGIVALGWALEPRREKAPVPSFTTEMSIREIAPKLDATGKALARELGLPVDVPKARPLRKLGVGQDKLDHVAQHPQAERDPMQRKRASARVTRLLRLLRAHRLIRKVSRTFYYRITIRGNAVMATALKLREIAALALAT